MNAAKGMDSVFADSTEKELEFDAMFDDDDSIIDVIAGVDEAGIPLTGEDFDWEAFDAMCESDQVGDKPDFDYPNDEVGSDYEGTDDDDLEIGGEIGDGKEVSGKENSAESQAYDDTKEVDDSIGLNDTQQTKLEAFDLLSLMEEEEVELGTMDNIKGTEAEKLVCPACGKNPCECSVEEGFGIEADVLDLLEAEDPIADDIDDADARDGKADSVGDTEGKDTKLFGAGLDGSGNEDPIADDIDDVDARDGKADSVGDTEGKDQNAVGAALEAFDILNLMEEAEEVDATEDNTADESEDECNVKEDAAEGPLEDDDPAERAGETSDAAIETESYYINNDVLSLIEAEEEVDATEDNTADDSEDECTKEDGSEGVIEDEDSEDERAGKVKHDTSNVEGEKQEVIGAALESDDFLDDAIDEADPDEWLLDIVDGDELVGDEVVQDLDDNSEIKVAKEDVAEEAMADEQEDDAIEDIDSESDDEGPANIESDYDDDDLIDAIINGDIEDL